MDGHSGETARLASVHRNQANGPVADVFEPVALSADRHTKVRVLPSGITGPLPSTFDISSFPAPASTSVRPTLRTVTLDELVRLLRPTSGWINWRSSRRSTGWTWTATPARWSVSDDERAPLHGPGRGARSGDGTTGQAGESRSHGARCGLLYGSETQSRAGLGCIAPEVIKERTIRPRTDRKRRAFRSTTA